MAFSRKKIFQELINNSIKKQNIPDDFNIKKKSNFKIPFHIQIKESDALLFHDSNGLKKIFKYF